MAKARVNCTIDEDLAAQFKDTNFSKILNDALRAMANTEINIPYYAKRKTSIEDDLMRISESLSYLNNIITDAKEVLADAEPRYKELEDKRIALMEELKSIEENLNENELSERKMQLMVEINNAIRKCGYNREDIERVVKIQIAEIKKLIPDFDLESHINLVKDWD